MYDAIKGLWPVVLMVMAVGTVVFILERLGLLKGGSKTDRKRTPTSFLDNEGEDENRRYRYSRKSDLLSNGELAFFRVLQSAVAGRCLVMVKVNLADLVKVDENVGEQKRFRTAHNQMSQKHVDFVLCDVSTLRPLAVIELDDRSHQIEKNRRRDEVKDRVLETAGLPLLRVRAAASYDVVELEKRVGEKVEAGT